MFCMSCGKVIPDEAKFCVFCGTPVAASVQEEMREGAAVNPAPVQEEMREAATVIPVPAQEDVVESAEVQEQDTTSDVQEQENVSGVDEALIAEDDSSKEVELSADENLPTEENVSEDVSMPADENVPVKENPTEEAPIEETIDTPKFCIFCGAPLASDSKFCITCGKPVEPMPEEPEPEAVQTEPVAQEVVEESQPAFCTQCGNKLFPGDLFCNQCGARVDPLPEDDVPREDAIGINDEMPEKTAPAEPAGFFDHNDYIIDEKVSAFKFTNGYRIYDTEGTQIGAVEQQKLSGGAVAARLLLGSSAKSMQAFHLDITDADGHVIAGIERGGIGGGMKSLREVSVLDAAKRTIGKVKVIPHFTKSEQEIYDAPGHLVARVDGDWKGWNFQIVSTNGRSIGTVSKNWNGVAKELFTTADKYRVSLSSDLGGTERRLIGAAAITIDMILHELA